MVNNSIIFIFDYLTFVVQMSGTWVLTVFKAYGKPIMDYPLNTFADILLDKTMIVINDKIDTTGIVNFIDRLSRFFLALKLGQDPKYPAMIDFTT